MPSSLKQPAERKAALEMMSSVAGPATLGADKGYDTKGFVADLRAIRMVAHVVAEYESPRRLGD